MRRLDVPQSTAMSASWRLTADFTPAIANDGQIVANFTDTLTLADAISGTGTLSKAGPGTLTLTGNSSYTGATTVNGGTLSANGSIATLPSAKP